MCTRWKKALDTFIHNLLDAYVDTSLDELTESTKIYLILMYDWSNLLIDVEELLILISVS